MGVPARPRLYTSGWDAGNYASGGTFLQDLDYLRFNLLETASDNAGDNFLMAKSIGRFAGIPSIPPRTLRLRWALPAYCGRHVMSTRTGISFLTGIVKSEGGSILKSDSVAGIVPVIWVSPLGF